MVLNFPSQDIAPAAPLARAAASVLTDRWASRATVDSPACYRPRNLPPSLLLLFPFAVQSRNVP
jgi:hypothetical protein